jgi:hypothetical protein
VQWFFLTSMQLHSYIGHARYLCIGESSSLSDLGAALLRKRGHQHHLGLFRALLARHISLVTKCDAGSAPVGRDTGMCRVK